MSYSKMNNSSGLTLIEVLISMVILVVGILSVMTMLSTAAKGNAEARKMTRALHIAEENMEQFLLTGNCSCTDAPGWIDACNNTSMASPPNGTSHCKVTVQWTSYGEQKTVNLETLRTQ